MELFILIISLLILIETTIIIAKNFKKTPRSTRRKVFIDTSTLMDGRILEVAKTNFLSDEFLIPRSVIRELQLLADGTDSEKRTRASFGLDVANQLERVVEADVEIFVDTTERVKVDEQLIDLAHEYGAAIMTNDFNLNKVATTEKIEVLNINDLALSLRMEYMPGDKLRVKILTKGSEPKQGIGHLPDGTMVVVDKAEKRIGKEVEIELVRYLQTSAGKMMFARLVSDSKPRKRYPR